MAGCSRLIHTLQIRNPFSWVASKPASLYTAKAISLPSTKHNGKSSAPCHSVCLSVPSLQPHSFINLHAQSAHGSHHWSLCQFVVFLFKTTVVSSRTDRIRQTHALVRALTAEEPRMVKVDPDLQRIAGKPAYLAFLSDIRGWGIFICVWTQCVPIRVMISSYGTSQKDSPNRDGSYGCGFDKWVHQAKIWLLKADFERLIINHMASCYWELSVSLYRVILERNSLSSSVNNTHI